MQERRIIYLTGLLGLLASILVGAGEFLLHYSPHLIGNTENYRFFSFVPKNNLIAGHFLAVIGTPFYFVGYYHIYKMLKGPQNKWAFPVFALGIIAFTVGGFWISSRAFLGTIVLLNAQIDPGVFQQILDNYTLISESLVQGLRLVILLLSIAYIFAILKLETHYDKWMVFFNPITLLVAVFAVYFIAPVIGKYIAPIAMNVVHFILFALSIIQFNKNYR